MHEIAPNVRNWASLIDDNTTRQAAATGRLPILGGPLALMPDAHFGLGSTVGSVIPTEGAIIPSAVGVDIGCGMIAVETTLGTSDLPDDLGPILSRVEELIPAGVGQGHESSRSKAWDRFTKTHGKPIGATGPKARKNLDKVMSAAPKQLGTLGSGNHFWELCSDERGVVWITLHSGSRGPGNRLAQGHIATAKGLMKERLETVDDPDLSWLAEGEPEFQAYMHDLTWAQAYAYANREVMMDAGLIALADAVGVHRLENRRINCHHNYTAREVHDGKEMWITRKGAIKAGKGDLGIIPGSMAVGSFIVSGLGNPLSYESASHGAGRTMGRNAAKRAYAAGELSNLDEAMQGITWLSHKGDSLIDEHPNAYKSLTQVMEDQKDLVHIEHQLNVLLNYKGT